MNKGFTPRVPRKFVGKYRPKIDGPDKASGKAVYADDMTIRLRFPNMLYASVLRSPYPSARIKSFDISKAQALPGVAAIMTYKDPEFASLKLTSAGWTDAVDTVNWDHIMFPTKDRRVLGEYACWVGDEMGIAVAAETEEIADEALKLITIDWDVRPFVLDPIEAMKKDAPLVHPDLTKANVLEPDPKSGPDIFEDRGNVDEAFRQADFVVEGDSTFHNAHQGAMDNWCCLAEWKEHQLTVWSNSYGVDQTRMHISEMLGLPLHQVRAISSYVGGQFGKNDTGDQPFFLVTSLLAMKTGRPVKYRHNRHQSFINTRQPAIYHFKVGAKKDGTLTSLHLKSIGNVGAYADLSMFALKFVPKELVEVVLAHIPNIRLESYGVYTNVIPGCMMRGVGNSQFNLILAHLVDATAERLGMDPVDFCIKNFAHEWEPLPSKSLEAVLHEGVRRLGWKEKRHLPGKGEVVDGVKRRGVGFSFHPAWHSEWQEERRGKIQVTMTLNPDCTVLLNAASIEVGGGSNTCNILGCAEALGFLGIGPEEIHWTSFVDTNDGVKDCVQTDSAVSYLQSEVMVFAAKEMKEKLRQAAATILKLPPSDIDFADGKVLVASQPALDADDQGDDAQGRQRAHHGGVQPVARREAHGRPLLRELRRGRGRHEHGEGHAAEVRRPQRLRHGDVRLGGRRPAGRRPGHGHGRGPDRGDHLRQGHGHPAQLQLGGLHHPDHGGHARHRPGPPRGVEGSGRVRGMRDRRGHRVVHARGDRERDLQRHRRQGERHPDQAGKDTQGPGKGLRGQPWECAHSITSRSGRSPRPRPRSGSIASRQRWSPGARTSSASSRTRSVPCRPRSSSTSSRSAAWARSAKTRAGFISAPSPP